VATLPSDEASASDIQAKAKSVTKQNLKFKSLNQQQKVLIHVNKPKLRLRLPACQHVKRPQK
jgi:hypothetical protein